MSLVEYLINQISIYGTIEIIGRVDSARLYNSMDVKLRTSEKGVKNGLRSIYDSNFATFEEQLLEISRTLIRDLEGRI